MARDKDLKRKFVQQEEGEMNEIVMTASEKRQRARRSERGKKRKEDEAQGMGQEQDKESKCVWQRWEVTEGQVLDR